MSYHLKSIVLECRHRVLMDDYAASMGGADISPESFEQRYTQWKEELSLEGIAVLEQECGDLDQPVLFIVDDPGKTREHLVKREPVMMLLVFDAPNKDYAGIKYVGMHLTEISADYFDKVYRRFAGIPWDILETKRCFLRETGVADVDAFYRIYAEPSITAYMEDLYPDKDQEIAYTQDYIKNVYELYGHGVWTVCLKETGEVIGRAGLSFREGYEYPELGFVIGVPWQGQGIATEVCKAVLDFGVRELDFSVVIAFVESGNRVSRHLLQGLGFQEETETILCGKKHLYCKWNSLR